MKIRAEDRAVWTDGERESWRLPEALTVSEWADRHRELDAMSSAEPGRWRTSRTPYLRGIMDAFSDPLVESITVMASTQIGKTEALNNMLAYAIDQDPNPALYVMPTEDLAKSVTTNRLDPMLKASEALREHLPHKARDLTKLELHLDHMVVYLAGANSPAGLSSRPIRYLFFDEVDKYPKFSGREADPVKLGTERTRTFWNKKIVKVSTPTTRDGYIFREYEASDQRRYYVPCPHCVHYQALVNQQIKIPDTERDPERIRQGRLAWYECEDCGKRIEDRHKAKMLERGVWCPRNASVQKDGTIKGDGEVSSHRGFWINALYSPWLTFSDIMAEFLSSKDSTETLMNFVNSWLAEVWEEKIEEWTPEWLVSRCEARDMGVVPAGALVLTGGVDVQLGHFFITIRAWGYGEENWQVWSSRVETWEDVERYTVRGAYKRVDGTDMPVRLTCFDSGFRASEVYDFCRRYRDVARAIKGRDQLAGAPFRVTTVDRTVRLGKEIKGGLQLWMLDTTYFKDKLARMITAEDTDAARFHLCAEPPDSYLKQMCSERKVVVRNRTKGTATQVWQPRSAAAKNHYWDCEVYATAAAEMLHVAALRKQPGERAVVAAKARTEGFISAGEGFIGVPRKGWVSR